MLVLPVRCSAVSLVYKGDIMETIITSSITAAVTFIVCLVNNWFQHKQTMAVLSYRLQELEKKVDKHNNLIERMYACEEQDKLQDAELRRVNARLSNLEGGKSA